MYAPTDDFTLIEKDKYEEKLAELLSKINKRKELIFMGDFNARAGRATNHPVIGNYGEETINSNGSRLIGICETYELKILNVSINTKKFISTRGINQRGV